MTHRITLIPGDGIGPQVAHAVKQILRAADVAIEWDEFQLADESEAGKTALLADIARSIKRNGVALQGKSVRAFTKAYPTLTVALRKELELFANVRPIRSLEGLNSRYDQLDLVMIRENLHDVYAGVEHEVVPGVVQSIRVTTRAASERIVRFAFDYIQRHGRRKLSVIHKANIMKVADGLFLEAARRVRPEFPAIDYEELIVDNTAMQLMSNPYRFDVLLMPNLYGDILSDLAGGLAGGWVTVPSKSINNEIAVFEAIHGYSPELVGTPWANPLSLLTSTIYLLRHIGEVGAANRIETATHAVIASGSVRTPDMGGSSTTDEMVSSIINAFP